MDNILDLQRLLEKDDRRYSLVNTFRGGKLSVQNMNRTRSLKLQKIKHPKSTHSQQLSNQGFHSSDRQVKQDVFLVTRSRILKRNPADEKKLSKGFDFLMVHASESGKQEQQPSRASFYSSNLHEKMNLYLADLLLKSSQEHKLKLKQIQTKIEQKVPRFKITTNSQNVFWRKMHRYRPTRITKANLSP